MCLLLNTLWVIHRTCLCTLAVLQSTLHRPVGQCWFLGFPHLLTLLMMCTLQLLTSRTMPSHLLLASTRKMLLPLLTALKMMSALCFLTHLWLWLSASPCLSPTPSADPDLSPCMNPRLYLYLCLCPLLCICPCPCLCVCLCPCLCLYPCPYLSWCLNPSPCPNPCPGQYLSPGLSASPCLSPWLRPNLSPRSCTCPCPRPWLCPVPCPSPRV